MRKIFIAVLMVCSLAVPSMAVTVNDVAGTFKGALNIGGQNYPNKEVYILPGTVNNTITFVLPDFMYGAAPTCRLSPSVQRLLCLTVSKTAM